MKKFIFLIYILGFTTSPLASHEHVVELFNAHGQKTLYRHYEDGSLHTIETYEQDEKLQSRDTFYWESEGSLPPHIKASSTEDDKGNIQSYSTFDYDPDGRLKREVCFKYKDGHIETMTSHHYTIEGCLKNSQQEEIEEQSDSATPSLWKKMADLASWCADGLENISKYMAPIREELSYSNYIQPQATPVIENVFGTGFLQFAGYYRQENNTGIFNGDQPEVNSKIRITMINGILSLNKDLEPSLLSLSQSHGNNPIHYVFRATEGWTKDILQGRLIKWGYISEQSHMLAQLWIDLIEELGGVDGDGTIIHYAHSVGAIDTYNAQFLLTPEQRRMIHVITIGSPAMIPNEGFASVINYASKRDGVCLLDPFRFIGSLFDDTSNVIYLDTFWGTPLIDHPLSVESYQQLIKDLGEKFLDTHQTP